ncbi:hypothetical protein FA95DRAFT_806051 [Auriscalpium vulgare]|uniref:Uncharacterized protein n=1 Tax=Auriscalpium vulgare TaxID=40419 RepID=A0ACB8RAE5_9AGAM|nr:hypothetical protein FA95DRAFT_806051 [Auriscalpium vulgare]
MREIDRWITPRSGAAQHRDHAPVPSARPLPRPKPSPPCPFSGRQPYSRSGRGADENDGFPRPMCRRRTQRGAAGRRRPRTRRADSRSPRALRATSPFYAAARRGGPGKCVPSVADLRLAQATRPRARRTRWRGAQPTLTGPRRAVDASPRVLVEEVLHATGRVACAHGEVEGRQVVSSGSVSKESRSAPAQNWYIRSRIGSSHTMREQPLDRRDVQERAGIFWTNSSCFTGSPHRDSSPRVTSTPSSHTPFLTFCTSPRRAAAKAFERSVCTRSC